MLSARTGSHRWRSASGWCSEAEALHEGKSILCVMIGVDTARAARKSLDVAGHYSRPDVLRDSD
jgi:hypothetical protein